jgi:CheY-like chemotaxis protein/HPt (histidine-containing phosphotransfer) domain-containing protein
MPVYSLSIANVLNGASDNFVYHETVEPIVKFIAPDINVLIVDDINTNLCLSGMEAIEAVKQKSYDIVFMDHMMPEMNGIEATAHIRGLGPEYAKLPVVALTANAVTGTKEKFLQNGIDDFLSKPIDTVKLDAILEKWIPKEKQNMHVTESEHKAIGQDAVEFEIEGVNVRAGIEMSGKMADRYLHTLAVFSEDARKKVMEIKLCLQEDRLFPYTTYMHALKGASANIGAVRIAKAAQSLETAGLQGDSEFIREHNDRFLADLDALLISIDEAISEYDSNNEIGLIDKDALNDKLARLKVAVIDFDIGVVNSIAMDLQNLARTGGIGDVIGRILKCILIGEYDEAVLLIDNLLG